MQTARDDPSRSIRHTLFSLDVLQWVLLVVAVLIGGLNLTAAALRPDPLTLATARYVLPGLGWPLFGWGMLPRMRIVRLKTELGELVRRDRDAMGRRLRPSWPTPRDWCTHIGFVLVLGGMVLSFAVPGLQILAGALLVLYMAATPRGPKGYAAELGQPP